MLYAIGEIILVVIGILIALYVNNASEESKVARESAKYLDELTEQIHKDITQIDEIIKEYEMLETMVYKVTGTPDSLSLTDCEDCLQLLIYFSFPEITDRAIYNLDKIQIESESLNEVLRDVELGYQNFFKVNDIYLKYSSELLDRNTSELLENQEWFKNYLNDGICDDKCQEYISSSMDFRKRIAYINLIIYNSYQYDLFEQRSKLCKYLNSLEVFTQY